MPTLNYHRRRTVLLFLFFLVSCRPAQDRFSVISPDTQINFTLQSREGIPTWSLKIDGQLVVNPSQLGFEFRNTPALRGPFKLLKTEREILEETWEPVWGQENIIHSHSHAGRVQMREMNPPHRLLNLQIRVFNDGIAFRYEIPEQEGVDSLFITKERTSFNLAQDADVWWIPGDPNSYEQIYTESRLSEMIDSVHTPLTIRTDSGLYLSIHEAVLSKYSAMTLKPSNQAALSLSCDLVPWSDGDKVKGKPPLLTPWRTITIGRQATDLLASRMILNLNEPNRLDDVSWIQAMKYIGIWWGMHINKYSWTQGEKHGATTANVKRYIDFASQNNIQGVLAEGWNHDWERYGQGKAFKFTEPYDDFDIQEITDHARSRGVELIGHHETGREAPYYDEQLEDAYAYLSKYGISAVKTGYAGPENIYPIDETHHGQWMVEHHQRVVEMAAKYQVAVNVHEPVKATGLERTWPNLMTREGTRGMEWNAWSEGNPPSHTTILPFTRQIAGPLDYTPGIFDLHFDDYKPDNRVHTTLAKQLGLMVILYSPQQMAADLIENYEGQAAFKFIRDLKVDWDESRYLEGKIGEFVTIARRASDDWFLGAITNEESRTLSIPLADFLATDMIAECYVDGAGAHWESNPYPMHIDQYQATPSDTLKAFIAPGGGMAIRFRPLDSAAQKFPNISELMSDQ